MIFVAGWAPEGDYHFSQKTLWMVIALCQIHASEGHPHIHCPSPSRWGNFFYNNGVEQSQRSKEKNKAYLQVKLRGCAAVAGYNFKSALEKIIKSCVSWLISDMVQKMCWLLTSGGSVLFSVLNRMVFYSLLKSMVLLFQQLFSLII